MEGFRYVKKEAGTPALNFNIPSPPQLRNEIEESTTFYYSNFKLLNEQSELLFSKYISFKKDLNAFLDEEWYSYASKTVSKPALEGPPSYVTCQEVFNAALEVWLELQKDVKMKVDSPLILDTADSLSDKKSATFDKQVLSEEEAKSDVSSGPLDNDSEENKILEVFQGRFREKFSKYEINEAYFKAVTQAFSISATKMWREMLITYFGDPTHKANGGFLIESKKFLMNKIQNLYNSKAKLLKPILVATERIKDFVIDPAKLRIPSPSLLQARQQLVSGPTEIDLRNLTNFSSTWQTETPSTPSNDSNPDDEQDLKRNFRHLQISSHSSQASSNGDSVLGKRSAHQANSTVEIKKVNKKLEKLLNPTTIEFAAYYVNNLMKTSNVDWQVSRSFVTHMIEVKYNKLMQLENRLHSQTEELGSDVRVRFIQPAKEFYNRLMETWIIFKTQSLDREILFTEYLEKAKGNLGGLWNDKFVGPTQNFFMTLYYEWNHLKNAETDTEQKVLLFMKKVKENMLKTWEENIVKKAEELSNRVNMS